MSEKLLFLRRCSFNPPKSELKSARIQGCSFAYPKLRARQGDFEKILSLFKGDWGGADTSETYSDWSLLSCATHLQRDCLTEA